MRVQEGMLLLEVGSWLLLGLLLGALCSKLGPESSPLFMGASAGLAGSIIGGSICRLCFRESQLLRYSSRPLLFAGCGAVVAALAISR